MPGSGCLAVLTMGASSLEIAKRASAAAPYLPSRGPSQLRM